MRYEMKMPDLATTESEIRIVRWIIGTGQKIARGQPLLEVETDKATMEVESPVAGILAEVRSEPGEAVSVGQLIAVLEVEQTASAAVSGGPAAGPQAEKPAPPPKAAERPVSAAVAAPRGMFARNRAAAAAASAPAPAEGIPLTIAQRVAARRLQESKQTIPHFYLQTSFSAAAMIARRRAVEPVKLAWDAFFVLAVARAIAGFERFHCRFDGERLAPAESDAIGVAVDHQNELFVIPIAAPATKTVEQISAEIRRGAEQLRSGDPQARQIRPTLLTVTNLGVSNIEGFIPIINPPEAAVLGVGRVRPAAVAREDGRIEVEQRGTLTLSVDHRIASGRYAAAFLGAIVKELESI
jgi:pyruvate dehydrogenase E2 component (dihydrolipoamide acetyltransferase)